MFAPHLSFLALTMIAPPGEQPPALPDNDVGVLVSQLMGQGCVGVVGEITSVGQAQANTEDKLLQLQPFELKVESTFFGKAPKPSETLKLTAATYPPSRIVDELWTVWRGIPVKKGTKLFVLLWPESRKSDYMGIPRTIAWVGSNERDIDRVLRMVKWNERHQGSVQRLAVGVIALDGRVDFSDPLYAGYVVGRLLGSEKLPGASTPGVDDERSEIAQALVLLLSHERARVSDKKEILTRLARDYSHLTATAQEAVAKGLIRTATGEGELAQFAVYQLGGICKANGLDLKPHLTADLKKKLLANYKAAIAPRPGGFKGYPEISELAEQLEGK